MKSIKQKLHRGLALAALTMAVASNTSWAASDIVISPSGSETGLNNNNGEWQNMWGPAFSSISWDTANPPPTGNTQGSIYNQGTWTSGGQDNFCIASAGNWWGAVTFDAAQYASIEMDIKYDITSTITPASQAHLEIGFDRGYWFLSLTNYSFNTGQTIADGNWHHLSIPVPANISQAGACHAVGFYQWNPSASGTMNFWAANVVVVARVVPTPPPTVKPLAKAIKGFNVFNNSAGLYDRQEAMLVQDTGLSWVGQATAANPVSYSFTIAGFPQAPSGSPEAYLFLSPNPGGTPGAPDWNETNCVVVYVQSSGSGTATMYFQYKVGNENDNSMYNGGTKTLAVPGVSTNNLIFTNVPGSLVSGPTYTVISPGVTNVGLDNGNLGRITSPTPYGTWTVKFTSDTNVTLINPSGSSTNLVIPPYNIGALAPPGTTMHVYLGGQANNADAQNQAVVYSNFSISNSAAPFSEDFTTETDLAGSVWNKSMTASGAGVLIVPSSSAYWLAWTLPASGFSSQVSSNLANPLAWTSPAGGTIIPMNGASSQLVSTNNLPPGSAAFFSMIKRTFTQLQVLLPGETNAPGTVSGKIGTPTAQSTSTPTDIVVNACDATWHVIQGATDAINLTSSDGSAFLPNNQSLVNGTTTFSGGFLFQTQGTQTVTATDVTDGTKTANTSSSVTVGP